MLFIYLMTLVYTYICVDVCVLYLHAVEKKQKKRSEAKKALMRWRLKGQAYFWCQIIITSTK